MSATRILGSFALSAAWLLACPAVAQEGKWAAPDDPTAKMMIDLERQWAESGCTGNPIVKTLLADDYQGTSPAGEHYSKADAVARETGSAPTERNCRLLDAKVRFFGDNVAIIYGKETATSKGKDGAEHVRTLIWTDTWLRRDGKWQIVAAQDMAAGCK